MLDRHSPSSKLCYQIGLVCSKLRDSCSAKAHAMPHVRSARRFLCDQYYVDDWMESLCNYFQHFEH